MNHKTCYWKKISIDSAISTRFKLIFLVTIALFFITTVSFAQENTQRISFDCTKEKSIHKTILPNTEQVFISYGPCICAYKVQGYIKSQLNEIGKEGGYRDFEEFSKVNSGQILGGSMLPRSEGESIDYIYYCWTKEQLKAYYDELKQFSGKPKD